MVWLLPSVEALVDAELGWAGKALGAVMTGVGALPRVCSLMDEEIGFISEALPTHQAGVGALPRMRLLVGEEAGFILEALAAVRAGVGCLPSVGSLMCLEHLLAPEAFPALPACIQHVYPIYIPHLPTVIPGLVAPRFSLHLEFFCAHRALLRLSGFLFL